MASLMWSCILLTLATSVVARTKSPLLDDEPGGRSPKKAAECVFGKQVRELGSQWIPDLGVPIGVLYCMKCECVPLQKKRRIVARVQCRSIKNECPEPTCAEPVNLPGRCCKTCPGETNNPDLIQNIDVISTNQFDDEKNTKHYAALLTGRSSLVLNNDYGNDADDFNKNTVVATGRFIFHKKNLHFSFYISEKAARPRLLQFQDGEGKILEEFVLSETGGLVNSLYQNATRKVCGIWHRLPREYKKLLRQEQLYAALIWGEKVEFTLSGQLARYTALATETFSSLLEPAPGSNTATMAGTGGTAIVSISTSASTSIHLAIIFNGIFTKDEISDVAINVTLSRDDKKNILQQTIRVRKPAYELNLIEISSPVTVADLRLLTRGKLLLTVSSVSKPEALRLSGNVITKTTCELFQATLSSDHNANPHGTSGVAWMYLGNEGSLVYNVQIDDLKQEQSPVFITLVDVTNKRRITELEDLTPYHHNGWVNGTLEKLSPKVLEPLHAGNLAVNVATPSDNNLIRGRFTAKLVADARDAPAPFLLKRENYTLPPSAAGLAWISVDSECHIHYDISISGLVNHSNLELMLELMPMLAPGAPKISRLLVDDFIGGQIEGSPMDTLTPEELNRLDSGVGFLKVREKNTQITLLVATIRHVIIPQTCRLPNIIEDYPRISPDQPEHGGACFHEGKFYQEEAQWTSSNPCTTCFCQNGLPKCFNMQCPEILCPLNMRQVQLPGECCPSCIPTDVSTEMNRSLQKCYFGNGKMYFPGSKFHPFLIPNGFDVCTICTCDPERLEIKCSRISNEKNCCKGNCLLDLNGTAMGIEPELPSHLIPTVKPTKAPQSILAEGGCRNFYNSLKPYPNGSEYHPSIDTLGEYKCVTCKCLNGTQTCKRQHCNKETCSNLRKLKKQGTKINSNDFCCSLRDCKKFRQKKHKPIRQTS